MSRIIRSLNIGAATVWAGWCVGIPCPMHAAEFAVGVESYDPGVGFATEYGTGLGYTLESAVLGQPNTQTFFEAVHPFNPPFERSELLSIGEGGHLTVRFDLPIQNHEAAYFGVDFIIYGSTGFVDSDYPNRVTDGLGSTFGNLTGESRVSVSRDNVVFFQLDSSLAPGVDGLYPTDGTGQFGLPVDPGLGRTDFAGRTAAEIKSLYGGSAGGTGFDLAWARDADGLPVLATDVRYVRIDVLFGRAEIDGFAVVPEPGMWVLMSLGFVGVAVLIRARRRHESP